MKQLMVFLLTIAIGTSLHAQEQQVNVPVPKYVDSDNDGMNDLFRDADGNGVNDVDGEEYLHRYPIVDNDGDGKNDVFLDADGDGINDLFVAESQNRGQNRYRVIDTDGDGLNDITGEEYQMNRPAMPFRDEDGDGINDIRQDEAMMRLQRNKGQNDYFTDSDGDGINDGRGFSRERRRHEPIGDIQGGEKGNGNGGNMGGKGGAGNMGGKGFGRNNGGKK